MTKGNVGSLLVFDPSKLSVQSGDQLKSASSDAVAGIVTERGMQPHALGLTCLTEPAHTRTLHLHGTSGGLQQRQCPSDCTTFES